MLHILSDFMQLDNKDLKTLHSLMMMLTKY